MTARSAEALSSAMSPRYDVVDLGYERIKPGIPLLLPIALLIWAMCALCYGCFRVTDIGMLACAGVLSALASSACVAAVIATRKALPIILCIASVLAGSALASYGAYQIRFAAEELTGISQEWEFALLEDAKAGSYGSYFSAAATGANGMRANVSVSLYDDVDLLQGDIIVSEAVLSPPEEDDSEYLWSRGLSATARLSSYQTKEIPFPISLIHGLRVSAIRMFADHGEEQAGLLQALVCGYRNGIQESGAYESYKVLGLAHLVAVSGAHLAIVTALLRWFLQRVRTPRWCQSAITIAFVFAYLVFSGIPLSALRAACMVVLSTTAFFAKRRAASLNSLAFCIIAFLALSPSTSVSVSFFLSAGSTLGIVLFAGLISSWFSELPEKARKLVGEPMGLTLASNMVTLPYSAALFAQVPLLAPLANVIAAPLFSLACIGGLLSASIALLIPGTAGIVICVAGICALPLSVFVDAMASIPYACVPVDLPVPPMISVSVIACLALWVIWPNLRLKTLLKAGGALSAVMFAFLFIAPRFSGDELVMLDVGQGDAFLIRSGGSAVLVDTGNQDSKLREGLGMLGVYSLDAVLISHHDDDHMGCLDSLSEYEHIGAVYCAEDAISCACTNCGKLRELSLAACPSGLKGLNVGDTITVGRFTLTVIWPARYEDEGGNADSVCLLMKADMDSDGIPDWQALLTGDAESEELARLVEDGSVGDIDILKVGHHGSKVTLTDELAETLSPEVALISVGAKNRYGHPSQEALGILQDADAQIYRTDIDGTVKVKFTTEKLIVSAANGS